MEFFEKIRLPLMISILVAAVLSALNGVVGTFTVGSILKNFFIFSMGTVGLTFVGSALLPSLQFGTSGRAVSYTHLTLPTKA